MFLEKRTLLFVELLQRVASNILYPTTFVLLMAVLHAKLYNENRRLDEIREALCFTRWPYHIVTGEGCCQLKLISVHILRFFGGLKLLA